MLYLLRSTSIKKIIIFSAFLIIWLISLFYIILNIKVIDTNIYSLINIEDDDILLNINKNLSSNVLFLFDNSSDIDKLSSYNEKYNIFQSINSGVSSEYNTFQNDINTLKIATFKNSDLKNLETNQEEFFYNHINSFLSSFIIKILPLDKDFFMLSSHSSLLDRGDNFKYDIENDIIYIEYYNKTYYMAQAILKDKYNPSYLLKLVNDIKVDLKDSVIISGGALFNADGHKKGIRESIYMTILSILLSGIALLVAFQKKSILSLMTIIIFSLTLGLAGCILIFDTIHILSIIVSASLIGLVIDFALHWLSHNQNKTIKSSSIKTVLKYIIINFIITALGYFLFIFSSMALLEQIAIISIITLFASLLYSIFFLPYILDGESYQQSKIFNKIFNQYIKSLNFLMAYKFIILSCIIIIISFGMVKFFTSLTFEDNIKNYSSINDDFLKDTIKSGEITGMKNPANYIIIDNYTINKENKLISTLMDKNLISNYKGLSQIFLSESQQIKLKNIFEDTKNNENIINSYLDIGFDRDFINLEFDKIISSDTLDVNEILDTNIANPFKYFYKNNKGVIFFESDKIYDDLKHNEEFNNVLSFNNATYYNLIDMINNYFSKVKKHALILKIIGIFAGFIILSFLFSYKLSLKITSAILLSLLFGMSIFSILSIDINIFAVFGFILAGAIGIDYSILMLNENMDINDRYFGLFTSALTSIISFIILTTSTTYAVFTFGLSVALSLFIFIYIIPLFIRLPLK